MRSARTTFRIVAALLSEYALLATFALPLVLTSLCGTLLAAEEEAAGEYVEAPLTPADREHWAFQPLVKPPLPEVLHAEKSTRAVDRFVQARLEKQGLAPLGEADRATLIRRLSFDLTGLSPAAAEVDRFCQDAAPDAYERLVDRLLASPAHGEHWAQHWLDLARFAETDGFEHDKVRPDAWKYRDWVIAAFNADLPYDQFVHLQLAADEMAGHEGDAIATMFCLAGPDMPDQNDQSERRHELLNEIASTVGSALLGLQVGCARCHDHKYDPISQADFYRLRAIFEPAVQVKKDVSVNVLVESGGEIPPSRLWIRGDFRRPGPVLEPAFPRIANPQGNRIAPPAAGAHTSQRRLALARWLTRADNPLASRVIANRLWQRHFGRGICDSPSDFGLLGASPTHPALLAWLACELVEHDWQLKRLHREIVGSATYRQAGRHGGSAFESTSAAEAHDWQRRLKLDPRNELLSRFPRQRLSGEALRDAMLQSAGLLNREAGGPSVKPPLAPELLSTLLRRQWVTSEREADHYRRSVYVFARRNLRYPLFDAFDRPDANASCPVRNVSTTAPQALQLLNSEFVLLVARHLAGQLQQASPAAAEQITLLFRGTLGRAPTTMEAKMADEFLAQQRRLLAAENRDVKQLALPIPASASDPLPQAALVDLCLALLNSSEMLYVD